MSAKERAAFPHCDSRVLHAPGECGYCDEYPDWQRLRGTWGIAFTGHKPKEIRAGDVIIAHELSCPADFNRPPGSPSDHRGWHGNVAKGKGN